MRITLVTGAAQGIGFGIAEHLAASGHEVVRADLKYRDRSALAAAQSRLGNQAVLAGVDITSPAEVERLIADILGRFGRIDCLVNSAGICRPATIQEADYADWQAVIGVNLTGAFLLSRAVAPAMIRQKSGRIVHIASTSALTAAAGLSAYAASKHGLLGLVRGMACDLTQHGITVNAICPGNNETEMLAKVIEERAKLQGRSPDEVREDIVRKTPAGRMGRPGDVAGAAAFLCSDEASYISGHALTVDGGRSLNLM